MSLRLELEAAGLNVKTVTGWGTRGGAWAEGKPIGVMQHHTALPVPFPVDRLYGDQLKCNINTKPDGTVWLIAANACNYSSGVGALQVLNEVRVGIAPPANALERNLPDSINGNPYFFNFENDHEGDGRPIPAVQHDAIVEATRVVIDHFGLLPAQVISHAEWTRRKRDPFWNGDLRAIEAIRDQLEDPLMKPPAWATLATQWHIDKGIYTQATPDDVDESNEFHRQTVFRYRFYEAVKGEFGGGGVSEAKVKELIASTKHA